MTLPGRPELTTLYGNQPITNPAAQLPPKLLPSCREPCQHPSPSPLAMFMVQAAAWFRL